MKLHTVKVTTSKEEIKKEDQLAWKLADLAKNITSADSQVIKMIGNRIIDNAAVAIAAINRQPVISARMQALANPKDNGATLYGMHPKHRYSVEWASWANNVAVRELDMHDTYLAADYSHPADNIPPLLAVAQRMHVNGEKLVLGILTAYEVHISLVKGICLHEFKKDHIAHIAPATVAGIGTMLSLETETIYQAIQHALHVCFQTRQSRKGNISSWKAYAPAFAGKMAIEATDRAIRGETSPSPIYEGEDSVIAYMLGGKEATYQVPLIEKGEPAQAILESYTKEHSAEYQAQALIDLAFKVRRAIKGIESIQEIIIYTSHHTHSVIGSGANDPQKYDPDASRETLDHSIMYIFAVALEDGKWHHVNSYTKERAHRQSTQSLWKKIRTQEDKTWTNLYHHSNPSQKAFGGKVLISFNDGSELIEEIKVANAHPHGESPFTRHNYIEKYMALTETLVSKGQSERFIKLIETLSTLSADDVLYLTPYIDKGTLLGDTPDKKGIL